MWVLECQATTKDGNTALLCSGEIVVGRKEADINIPTAKSVSRVHARIVVDESDLHGQQNLAICDLSKFGTLVNGEKLTPEVSVDLKHGDVVVFGAANNVDGTFRIKQERVLLCVPEPLDTTAQDRLLKAGKKLGVEIVDKWQTGITHVVTQHIIPSAAICLALLSETPIVTVDWVASMSFQKIRWAPFPAVNMFFPSRWGELAQCNGLFSPPQEGPDRSNLVVEGREMMFADALFVFLENHSIEVEDVVTGCGATCVTTTVEDLENQMQSNQHSRVVIVCGEDIDESQLLMSATSSVHSHVDVIVCHDQQVLLAVLFTDPALLTLTTAQSSPKQSSQLAKHVNNENLPTIETPQSEQLKQPAPLAFDDDGFATRVAKPLQETTNQMNVDPVRPAQTSTEATPPICEIQRNQNLVQNKKRFQKAKVRRAALMVGVLAPTNADGVPTTPTRPPSEHSNANTTRSRITLDDDDGSIHQQIQATSANLVKQAIQHSQSVTPMSTRASRKRACEDDNVGDDASSVATPATPKRRRGAVIDDADSQSIMNAPKTPHNAPTDEGSLLLAALSSTKRGQRKSAK